MTTPATEPSATTESDSALDLAVRQFADRAVRLDGDDPLAEYHGHFVQSDHVRAYLDGNSLGRPLHATRERLIRFVDEVWAPRLIRAWDEQWMDEPTRVGDEIGRIALGAAAGQTVVGDSTTVLLYKWIRAAVAARPGRHEIVLDVENFPTDRYVVEGIAAETGCRLVWMRVDPDAGATRDQVDASIGDDTALVVLSHVAFRSAYIADMSCITGAIHRAGALVLWDLSHSVGSVPMQLDAWNVDLAVGCSYKYLNGGPGAPAFGYVNAGLLGTLRQPIQGWMGAAEPFAMGPEYQAAPSIRGFLSGTPPILAMQAMQDMLALIDEVGIDAVRAKSMLLTRFCIDYADELLSPFAVRVASPRADAERGSHVTLEHPRFRDVTAALWRDGVIPDFRNPNGLRIGLSPLSTSFTELLTGLEAVRGALA